MGFSLICFYEQNSDYICKNQCTYINLITKTVIIALKSKNVLKFTTNPAFIHTRNSKLTLKLDEHLHLAYTMHLKQTNKPVKMLLGYASQSPGHFTQNPMLI